MSFTDLISSSRGPGVIGLVLGLIVLLGFGSLSIFVFDERLQGDELSLETVVHQQQAEIDELGARAADDAALVADEPRRKDVARRYEEAERELGDLRERLRELQLQSEQSRQSLDDRLTEWEQFKTRYRNRSRAAAKGEKIDDLTTLDGQVYRGVQIREVDAVGMQVLHDGGHKRIPYELLPPALQDRFQFNQAEKETFLSWEKVNRDRHDKEVARVQRHEARAAEEARKLKKAQEWQNKRQRIMLLQRMITAKTHEVRNLRSDLRHEQTKKGIRRTQAIEDRLNAGEKELFLMKQELAKLRANLK